ncbi:unnamed protein product [Prunus armeniaca]|uniref:Phytocyanin domain-containing protein n=1 Tax=Prunus armeniaca TaxID=36596 RepID=A0A6J5WXV3_PRUAR|nr:hypothetical protein GBA52_010564 [Prunus armeniaca]CAB4303904.1 unnamed protein product [Prunus armeniaca]
MASKRLIVSTLLVILMLGLASSSPQAYKFIVGGKDGWILSPSENFNHWAERHRFQVNDTLLFKYKKGSDSVLVVTKEDYFSCNTKTPKQSLTDGDSIFKFERSGPFFFISGNAENCQKGQKLIVVVLAVRSKTQRTPPSQAPPSPSSSAPSPLVADPPAVSPSPLLDVDTNAPAQPPLPRENSAARGSDVGLMVFICTVMSIGASTAVLGNFVV